MTNDTGAVAAHEDQDEQVRLTADMVLTADHYGDRFILLVRRRYDPFADWWALPGGYVRKGETAAAAAVRELEEETGVETAEELLDEVGVWHEPGRDPRGRVVTVVYRMHLAVCVDAEGRDDAVDAWWWRVTDLPSLAFDHAEILDVALRPAR